jgi:DNA-binding CsgD family transcriptional regulator
MHLTTTAPGTELDFGADKMDALFADRTVNAVLLDRSGAIVCVSQGWKAFAQEAGLKLPDFGVGQNYLRHCAYADRESSRIVEGIVHLLGGRIDFLSFIYPCHTPARRRWFLLLGFPRVKDELTALLHIDITGFMPLGEKREPVILADRFGVGLFAALFNNSTAIEEPAARLPFEKFPPALAQGARSSASTPVLSKRQREVLNLMAKGMSNVEIARALAISPNTVKIHVSGILARLGLPSRAQAIHWSLTRDLQERPRQSGS